MSDPKNSNTQFFSVFSVDERMTNGKQKDLLSSLMRNINKYIKFDLFDTFHKYITKSVTVNKYCCAVVYPILCLVYPKDHQHNRCTITQNITMANLLEYSILKTVYTTTQSIYINIKYPY